MYMYHKHVISCHKMSIDSANRTFINQFSHYSINQHEANKTTKCLSALRHQGQSDTRVNQTPGSFLTDTRVDQTPGSISSDASFYQTPGSISAQTPGSIRTDTRSVQVSSSFHHDSPRLVTSSCDRKRDMTWNISLTRLLLIH